MFNKHVIGIITQELFQFSLITYLALQLAEVVEEGIVSNFFNLNILLIVIITSGLGMILTRTDVIDEYNKIQNTRNGILSKYDLNLTFMLTIVGIAVVFYKTTELRVLSIFITFVITLLIICFSYLILTHDTD